MSSLSTGTIVNDTWSHLLAILTFLGM